VVDVLDKIRNNEKGINMKINTIILSLLLVSCGCIGIVWATSQNTSVQVIQPVRKCACGPAEHWFYKCCVKRYVEQFPSAGLVVNNDTEGLAENVVRAIEMLAMHMNFVKQDGTALTPELNAKGNLYLPMLKNAEYVLCKDILRHADMTSTLSSDILCQQWLEQLQLMKSQK